MKYTVYYLEDGNWKLLLSGLSKDGAEGHARMYKALFKTETKIVEEDYK